MRLGRIGVGVAALGMAIVAASVGWGRTIDARGQMQDGAAQAVAAPLQAGPPAQIAWQVPASPRKTAKLNTHLDLLYGIDVVARQAGKRVDASTVATLPDSVRGAVEQGEIRLDASGRVQVFVDVFDGAPVVAAALRAIDMEVQRVSDEYGIVQGMLPVSRLTAAAALPGVRMVRPTERPRLNTGSMLSEGDAILDADAFRAAFGSGAGVRVGVISDGVEGLAAAVATADLPVGVNTTTCDMVEGPPASPPLNPTDAGAGAEGTAMLEIVHDLAPGAELWFGYFGLNASGAGTSLDFIDAVDCLAANVDIVVDDITLFANGQYDGSGSVAANVSTELNLATNRIRGYYNAVGNQARRHYQESYVDSDPGSPTANLHLFQATADTTDALAIGAFNGDPVFLNAGGTITVVLSWNDPYGASANNYNLYLGRESDAVFVASSLDVQSGTQNPDEALTYTNIGAAGYFDIIIDKAAVAATRTLDLFIISCGCTGLPGGVVHNYNTISSSVPNNADAGGGVVSLGAINASDPGADTIASYSNNGPTNDGRTKPDAVAIDGVSVTGAGGFSSPFFGTSAAGPHAAAIAALLLGYKPSLKHGEVGDNPASDRTTLRSALLFSSVDLGVAGDDNVYGSGRLDADAAVVLLATVGGVAEEPDLSRLDAAGPSRWHGSWAALVAVVLGAGFLLAGRAAWRLRS